MNAHDAIAHEHAAWAARFLEIVQTRAALLRLSIVEGPDPALVLCPDCQGSGVDTEWHWCQRCQGIGEIARAE